MKLTPKMSLVVFVIFIVLGLAAGLIGYISAGSAGYTIGCVLLVAGFIFHVATYRCPHCGGLLGRNPPDCHCPNCGRKVNERA